MKTYLSVFVLRMKMELQYRAAALGGLITQVFFGLISVYLFRTLHGAGNAAALAGIATYVWLQQAFFRMLFSNDNTLTGTILRGEMAYQLVRPVDQYNYWFAHAAAGRMTGAALRSLPLLLIAALLPREIALGAPVSLAAFVLALVSLFLGAMVVTAVDNITSAIILKTLDNRGASSLITHVKMLMSGNLLPLTLFPDGWQQVLAFSPFSQILDTPIRLYTGVTPLHGALSALLIQAAWLGVLVLIGRMMWRKNLRRIIIQGG